MLLVDCPLCDTASPFDPEDDDPRLPALRGAAGCRSRRGVDARRGGLTPAAPATRARTQSPRSRRRSRPRPPRCRRSPGRHRSPAGRADRPPRASTPPGGHAPTSNSGGSSTLQRSNASGQRGWNRHPGGTCAASGVSPTRIVREARWPSAGGSGDGRHRDQRLGVRVARRPDDLLRRPDLHDLAEVHDGDPVGDDPGDRQVVGDEQVGQAPLAPQVEHQAQELGADRDVEHRDRLVGDDELRVHDQRPGDDDPLALAAGQLVRVAAPRSPPRGAGPAASSAARTCGSAAPASSRSCRRSAAPRRTSPIVCFGLSVSYGSWKISWTRRR